MTKFENYRVDYLRELFKVMNSDIPTDQKQTAIAALKIKHNINDLDERAQAIEDSRWDAAPWSN